MKITEKYQAFNRSMAGRGFTRSPLTYKQFCFLHVDCELDRDYIDLVAMDVASGVSMRHAVFSAIEAYRVDNGLAA